MFYQNIENFTPQSGNHSTTNPNDDTILTYPEVEEGSTEIIYGHGFGREYINSTGYTIKTLENIRYDVTGRLLSSNQDGDAHFIDDLIEDTFMNISNEHKLKEIYKEIISNDKNRRDQIENIGTNQENIKDQIENIGNIGNNQENIGNNQESILEKFEGIDNQLIIIKIIIIFILIINIIITYRLFRL